MGTRVIYFLVNFSQALSRALSMRLRRVTGVNPPNFVGVCKREESSSRLNQAIDGLKQTKNDVPPTRAILNGIMTVGSFLLIGKFIAVAKEMVVAARFGVSDIVDAYQFAFTLTLWPATFLGTAMVLLVVPLLSASPKRSDARDRKLGRLFGYVILSSVLISVGSVVVLPMMVRSEIFAFQHDQEVRVITMIMILSLALPASIISRFLAGFTIAARTHVNTLLDCLPALTILMLISIAPTDISLVLGGAIGLMLQCGLLIASVFFIGNLVRPRMEWPGKHEKMMLGSLGALSFSYLLLGSVEVIDQIAAASLPVGSLATLGYTNRIVSILLGLATTTLCRGLFPVLASAHANSRNHDSRLVPVILGMLGCGAVAAAVVMALLSEEVVGFIFERGAFSHADTIRVASALRWAVTRIPPYVITSVLMYAITSQHRVKPLFIVGITACTVKAVTAVLFVTFFNLPGLLVSTAVTYCATVVVGLWAYLKN